MFKFDIGEEASLPVNFGTYIGNEAGQDPGALNAIEVFKRQHRQISKSIRSKRNKTKQDFKNLEEDLNEIFFPEKYASENFGKDFTDMFIAAVNKGYNDLYEEKINEAETTFSNVFLEKNMKISKKKAQEIKKEMKNKKSKFDREKNSSIKVMEKELKALEDIQKVLERVSPSTWENLLSQITEKGKESIANIEKQYNYIIDLYKKESPNEKDFEKCKDYMVIKQDKLFSKDISIKDLQKGLKELDKFYTNVMHAFSVPPAVYGNYLEYGLALLGQSAANIKDMAENKVIADVQDTVKKTITGGSTTERGGNIYNGFSDFTDFNGAGFRVQFGAEYAGTKNKDGKEVYKLDAPPETSIDEHYENVTINFREKFDTGEDKMAKMDVNLIMPQGKASGKNFRISAKNWASIALDSEKIGDTLLFYALDRSIGATPGMNSNEVLLNYIFVMQHPDKNRRQPGVDALGWAHRIAKEAIVADILMGYSQAQGYADTLVILDRNAKRVYVTDIVQTMKNIFAENGREEFYVEGYKTESIENRAKTIRYGVMRGVGYKQRSKTYIGAMTQMLANELVTVKHKKALKK